MDMSMIQDWQKDYNLIYSWYIKNLQVQRTNLKEYCHILYTHRLYLPWLGHFLWCHKLYNYYRRGTAFLDTY